MQHMQPLSQIQPLPQMHNLQNPELAMLFQAFGQQPRLPQHVA